MISRRWFKYRIGMEPFHRYLYDTKNKHIRRCESAETINYEAHELETSSDKATRASGEFVEIAHSVCPEVEKANEQTTHEEERVDAERSVRYCLK